MSHAMIDQSCVDSCSHCSQKCFEIAMNHCLPLGGKHLEPNHFKLMLDCAKVCETCAYLQLNNSQFSFHLCEVCAELCEACAQSCEQIGEMDECVTACRRCSETCRRMAA